MEYKEQFYSPYKDLCEKGYWLDGSQEAVDKIKKLLGEDNIRQR